MARASKLLASLSLAIILVLLEISLSRGDNSVRIFSPNYRQRVTSSMLNWLPVAHYEASNEIVIGGFVRQKERNETGEISVKERSIYVCRVFHNGFWVAGAQIAGQRKCKVTYLGMVTSYERYDLLENVNNAARLSWVPWDKFHPTPVGAVATEFMYVARHVVKENENNGDDRSLHYTHYIASYDTLEGLGRIVYAKDDGTEGTMDSGEVLVETEPIFYELNSVKLNHKKRVHKRVPQVLRESTIRNHGSEPAVLAEALDYSFNHSIYWGQGLAMIKALNTSITLAKGPKLGHVSWGLEKKSVRSNATTVEIRLDPGTAVNVTLRANYTDMETQYSGELVSVYEDGERKSRKISGICREETMTDVKYEFGPIYYMANMSIVPTTMPPPSTEPITTTTRLTTTTTTSTTMGMRKTSETENGKDTHRDSMEEPPEIDENMIVPPRKSPDSMQNDDGGPLSLKNKVDGEKSSSTSPQTSRASLAIIAVSAIALYRIT